MNIGDGIETLHGVGKVRAQAYARMGIYTVSDLIEHYPRTYEDRGNIRLLAQSEIGVKNSFILTVATEPKVRMIRRGMTILRFRAYDDSGSCEITYFNQNYLRSVFEPGTEFRFYGVVEKQGERYFMSSPAYEKTGDDGGAALPPLCPVYALTEGLTRKQIAKNMESAVSAVSASSENDELLPEKIRRKNGLCTRSFALKNIHFPTDYASLGAAKRRLIYDEFFTFALGISLEGRKNRARSAYRCKPADLSPLLGLLPFGLTGAQKRVIDEIFSDMTSEVAMSRMVVGDVGCGKTVCAAAAMYLAVRNGRQAALMAPTEILAAQHFADISGLFSALGIKCALLTGSVTPAEKKRIYAGLAEEGPERRIDVVIGTHALLSEKVSFAAPCLVVTDEQHRFGVMQRAELSRKNESSHMLVMSATPIPRSLALAVYGDLDISRIDEMPPGRQRVDTFVVDGSYRARLEAFIVKQLSEGGQVYIVCPAVEETTESGEISLGDIGADGSVTRERPALKAAIPFAEELKEKFPDYCVEFIHGGMKASEKDRIMLDFAAGNIGILVSTTVIEVGVNVPNASLMIVENAERFGLSQLHQLRGRVGRGKRKSYCVLVSDSVGGDSRAAERLNIMKTVYDGYEIAERDLAMRGPGDFLRSNAREGIRQSGGVKFRLAELCDDTGLLKSAFADAAELLAEDPGLAAHPETAKAVGDMFYLDSESIS